MATKVSLWCGFCTVVYWTKKDGKGMTVTLTSRAEPRDTAEEAWADAQRLEDEQERFVKKEGARPSTVQPGICPPDYLY
jgi:hypothetical protein